VRRPRILLADDHQLFLEGLRRLLEERYEIVGAVGDGRALLAEAQRLRPDVILLDISMPLLNGIDAARQLTTLVPASRLVLLTMHGDPTYAREAFRAGASSYVVKHAAAAELGLAIRAALAGRRYVSPPREEAVLRTPRSAGGRRSGAVPLSPRQREVLQLVAEGRSAKEIGQILRISPRTVEFYRTRLASDLGVRTTAGLTRYAVAHGLVGP
jgi:DNA-binding NarL/FixJ family response regulator